MKPLKNPLPLLIIPALLAMTGCQQSNVQRDVYKSKEECSSDWGANDLCEEVPEEEVRNQGAHSTVFINGGRFWGPAYYPGDRSVNYNGQTFSARYPAAKQPFISVSNGSRAAMSSPGKPVSRGGFGGRSSSSFGG